MFHKTRVMEARADRKHNVIDNVEAAFGLLRQHVDVLLSLVDVFQHLAGGENIVSRCENATRVIGGAAFWARKVGGWGTLRMSTFCFSRFLTTSIIRRTYTWGQHARWHACLCVTGVFACGI